MREPRLRLPVVVGLALLGAALALAAGCAAESPEPPEPAPAAPAAAAAHGHGKPADPAAAEAIPLFDDLGTHHRAVTTSSPEAQRYFDQGLRLMYAFNLEEAQRSFEAAVRRDPGCASCSWGVALSLGPHINFPAQAERTAAAHRAVAAARRAARWEADAATPVERALIEALARRYADPPPADPEAQKRLDQAYADAMRDVSRRFPDDLDVATLAAEAMMDLRPWDLWTADGRPQPGTAEILATLERVLARDPRHPGANHYYIHAVEASPHPEKARGLALAAQGKTEAAGEELKAVRALPEKVPADAVEGLNSARALLALAADLLAGEIAARRGDMKEAVRRFESAVAAEDGLRYNEPSDWYTPVRHFYGEAMLAAGRPAEAQRVYEEDLERNPENGWALSGLAESLRRQGKEAAAAVRPEKSPVSPKHRPLSPNESLVRPKKSPVSTKHRALSPNESLVRPKESPVSPKHRALSPNERPVRPKKSLVSLKHRPLSPVGWL